LGAKRGILVKSGEGLERAAEADFVVLDKTGTLTVGKPAVTEVISVIDREELIRVVSAVERLSEHPLAKAVVDYCGEVDGPSVTDFETVPGKGVRAKVDGVEVKIGNFRYLSNSCDVSALMGRVDVLEEQGSTVFGVEQAGMLIGLIAVSDEIRPESRQAIAELKRYADIYMLTGDGKKVASHVANILGIENFKAEVLPEEKEAFVAELKAKGKVMFVGDGINDAPALSTADVGVAIGAGTDVAIDSADVVLTGSNPLALSTLIRLGRATMRKVKQNLFWAFLYNMLGIPLAAGLMYPVLGWKLSPMIGSIAMSMSSVCVVFNALSLRLFKDKTQGIPVEVEESMQEIIIKVEGMMCPHCKARVEGVVNSFPGLTGVVDLDKKSVTITVDGDINLDEVKGAITAAGYKVID